MNEIDDKEFFNVLNLVEEKNQTKKKGKKKKYNLKNKKNVAYKKNEDKINSISKNEKSSISNIVDNNNNISDNNNNIDKKEEKNVVEEKKNNNNNKIKNVEEISPRDIKKIEENINDYSAQNLLNMLDNKKINNTNNKKSFLEEEIEEINTNSSNLQRKKEEMRFRANAPKAQISNISNGYSQRRINNITNKINIGNISSDNDLQSTLEMFAKAEELKQQNEENKNAKKKESFWDKLFKPFKCGD